ncbi:MAG: OsmC family protein [Siculibacillus sp.]|nr:OsmC family protein [Siculibacillus sp.]
MKRFGTAVWRAGLERGSGTISTESGALAAHPYGFASRSEGEPGTNPEELIGAAHAGCFTMALSVIRADTGFPTDRLETRADVILEKIGDGFAITAVHLALRGRVLGVAADAFLDLATKARIDRPVSKVLKTVVTLDASLIA